MLLSAFPLIPAAVKALAPNLRPEDLREAGVLGYSPEYCLGYAAFAASISGPGECSALAVYSATRATKGQPSVVGAFGYTGNTVWSLWSSLSPSEGADLILQTPRWCRWLRARSDASSLENIVMASNKPALKWLEHSKCFVIDKINIQQHGDTPFYAFTMKPLADLPPTKETQA